MNQPKHENAHKVVVKSRPYVVKNRFLQQDNLMQLRLIFSRRKQFLNYVFLNKIYLDKEQTE